MIYSEYKDFKMFEQKECRKLTHIAEINEGGNQRKILYIALILTFVNFVDWMKIYVNWTKRKKFHFNAPFKES